MSKKIVSKKKEIEEETDSLPSKEELEEEESIKEDKNQNINKKREIQSEKGIKTQPSTGVIYVGHLPWGFIDSTLKKYFSQFGNITRIISPKSSKTGRSVGYAFIEFEDEETARIAAKTMNNYILFEKILKCNFVEDKTKYDRIFLKWKKKFEFKERYKAHCEKLSKKKTNEEIKTMIQGLLDREEQRREKMKELGIKYEYKGFKEIIEEYKKEHMNEINEKNKKKEEEKKVKKGKNKEEEENKEMNLYKEEEDDEEENEEEMEQNEEEEEEQKEEKEIIKNSKNIKKEKMKAKENNNNKKIDSVRKKRKLEQIEKKKKTEKIKSNKGKNKKSKK